jgi:NAD(P)-dependent dehydrogenase (short-subunit alcohol dehydrogenase family)
MSLDGKVAIISGAARGIGRACANRLAHVGAKVVVADINETLGEEVADGLGGGGHDARFILCNVAERLDVRNLIAETLNAYGRIDILVNNAAVMDSAPFLELREDELDRVFATNVKGAFLLGQAVARQMVSQVQAGERPGSIINMSSVNDHFALPDHVAYTMSKGALSQLTKAMSLALAEHGIRVNAIAPGSILTEMLKPTAGDPESARKVLSRTPLGRFGHPEEIAHIVQFLASDAASYITGETIYADGGRRPLNFTVDVKSPPRQR